MALMHRGDLAWLLPADRNEALIAARGDARAVEEALSRYGALFFDDLLTATGLLPAQLEDALAELAALGVVTADGFGAVRSLISRRRHITGRTRSPTRNRGRVRSQAGRWSRFPPFAQPLKPEQRLERWAWQLLRRYGVMFRDLLARESVAPLWHELLRVYRRLESRGEIRGGRFVAGVAGEQFALTHVVDRLRRTRQEPPAQVWHILSAADPLNLVGILTPGPRVPATRGNRITFLDARPLAALESAQIRWLADPDEPTRHRAAALLERSGNTPGSAVHTGSQFHRAGG
jgi:ATP-dependent Lhr-like helicase